MNFWQHLKRLFVPPSVEDTSQDEDEGKVLAHETLQRSPEEKALYQQWVSSAHKEEMLHWIQEQYRTFARTQRNGDPAIGFLRIPSVNGFVIEYDPQRWDADDFVCLFDYLKQRIRDLGYRTQVSDLRSVRRCGLVETTQRHYLKPPRQTSQGYGDPVSQGYGNVMITLCLVNEKIVNLKLSATQYHDRCYLPALEFSELLDKICILV